MVQHRRLLPRQFADWPGLLAIEGWSEARWRTCQVVDVSTTGAGIELHTAPPIDLIGQKVLLTIHLRAEVRHQSPPTERGVRLGLQFVDLSNGERDYIRSLENIGAVW
jgi:hypothetical protein